MHSLSFDLLAVIQTAWYNRGNRAKSNWKFQTIQFGQVEKLFSYRKKKKVRLLILISLTVPPTLIQHAWNNQNN